MSVQMIEAYIFQGDLFCSGCILDALPTGRGEPFDGWALAEGVRMSPEAALDELAWAFGIEREDETTFDSGYFPKVAFGLDGDDVCAGCGDPF